MLRRTIILPALCAFVALFAFACENPVATPGGENPKTITVSEIANVMPAYGEGSFPAHFTEFNGRVYFTALDYDDSDHRVLYYLDDSNNAVRVSTIRVDTHLVVFKGELYFVANAPGTTGAELYKCTTANVVELVEEIIAGGVAGASNEDIDQLVVLGDSLFFAGFVDHGASVYFKEVFAYVPDATNGDQDIVQVTAFGSNDPRVSRIFAFNGAVYCFASINTGSFDHRILKIDSALTVSYASTSPNNNFSDTGTLPVVMGNSAWFCARGPGSGHGTGLSGSNETDLYELQSDGTIVLHDIGYDDTNPSEITVEGTRAYFIMNSANGANPEWFSFDSSGNPSLFLETVAGSSYGTSINNFMPSANIAIAFDGKILLAGTQEYYALDSYEDVELLATDTSGSLVLTKEIGQDEVSETDIPYGDNGLIEKYAGYPEWFKKIGNKIYFAGDTYDHGKEVWVIELK